MTTETPTAEDTDLRALDRLVGTWDVRGEATGWVTYRWLPGNYFLLQEGVLELFGHRDVFLEVIGRDKPFGGEPSTDLRSRVYTAGGETLDYVYELEGDTLTIWGGHRHSGSAFSGTFSDGDRTLTGAWTWPGGGYTTTSTRVPDRTSRG